MARRPQGSGGQTSGVRSSIGVQFENTADRLDFVANNRALTTDVGAICKQEDTGAYFFLKSINPTVLKALVPEGGSSSADYVVGPDPLTDDFQDIRTMVVAVNADPRPDVSVLIKPQLGGYVDTGPIISITRNELTLFSWAASRIPDTAGLGPDTPVASQLDLGLSFDGTGNLFLSNIELGRHSSLGPALRITTAGADVFHFTGAVSSLTDHCIDVLAGVYFFIQVNSIFTFEPGKESLHVAAGAIASGETSILSHGDFVNFSALLCEGTFSGFNNLFFLAQADVPLGGFMQLFDCLMNAFESTAFILNGYMFLSNLYWVHAGTNAPPPYGIEGTGTLDWTHVAMLRHPASGIVAPTVTLIPRMLWAPLLNRGRVLRVAGDGTPRLITSNEYQINVTSAAPVVPAPTTFTLPAIPVPGQEFRLVDQDGGAFADNFTLAGNGNLIAGAATQVLTAAFSSIHVKWNGNGSSPIPATTGWDILAKYL